MCQQLVSPFICIQIVQDTFSFAWRIAIYCFIFYHEYPLLASRCNKNGIDSCICRSCLLLLYEWYFWNASKKEKRVSTKILQAVWCILLVIYSKRCQFSVIAPDLSSQKYDLCEILAYSKRGVKLVCLSASHRKGLEYHFTLFTKYRRIKIMKIMFSFIKILSFSVFILAEKFS